MHPGCLHATGAGSQQRGQNHSPSSLQSSTRTHQVPPNSIILSCSLTQQLDAPEMRMQRSGSCCDVSGGSALRPPGRHHPATLRPHKLVSTERTKASKNHPYHLPSKSLITTLSCLFVLVTLCLPFQDINSASWLRPSRKHPAECHREQIHPPRGSGHIKHPLQGTAAPTGSRCLTSTQEQGESPWQPGVRR